MSGSIGCIFHRATGAGSGVMRGGPEDFVKAKSTQELKRKVTDMSMEQKTKQWNAFTPPTTAELAGLAVQIFTSDEGLSLEDAVKRAYKLWCLCVDFLGKEQSKL